MRRRMKKGRDRKIFRKSAVASKKINLNATPMRGGIRL